jgi:hypothetical protein
MFLHDRVGWYRYWHHSPVRLPTHFVVALLALLIGGAVIFSTRTAENPQAATGIFAQFPFQGRLTNSDGTVVANANYDVVFKLYTDPSSCCSDVWTESHTGVDQIATVDGIFNTMLGSLNSLSGIDFNQDEYWLGITVGVDAEMTPRIRLGAAPYAFNSDKLNGLGATAFLQLNGQAGGQTAFGGTAASENLILHSTADATKGNILIAGDAGEKVGIGGTPTAEKLNVSINHGVNDSAIKISVVGAATGISATTRAISVIQASSNDTVTNEGVYIDVVHNIAYDATGINANATTIYGTAIGVQGNATQADLTGFGIAIGVKATVAVGLSGINNGTTYAGYFDNPLTVGNANYGVYINTGSAGTYGLYQNGGAPNYFSGYLGVGSTDSFQSVLGSVTLAPGSGIHVGDGSGTAAILLEGDDSNLNFINVTGAANGRWSQILQSSANFLGFFSKDDTGTLIRTSTTPNLSIDNATGNIGIGVADPFQTILGSVATGGRGLHIDAGSGFAELTLEGDDPTMDFINTSGGVNNKWTQLLQSSNGQLRFYGMNDAGTLIHSVSAPALSIDDSSNNVGIGTVAASFMLEVAGSVGPNADDIYDLGSSSLRWRDLYLGPTSLHLTTTVAETATARDWKLTVDETNGATDGDLRIQEGSNSYFTVTTAGNVVLGSAALATTATDGFLYAPSMAGAPTGVPTAYTGRVPYTYDSTSNALYAYNGGAWQQLTSMSAGAVVLNEVSAPSATTNQGKLYVQSIAGGNSVFFKDENGVATDLINNVNKLTTGEALRIIRGSVAANGTITTGSGFSITHTASTGIYQINFTTAFSVAPTITTSAVYNTGAARLMIPSWYSTTTSNVQINTYYWQGSSPGGTEFTLTDNAFDFVATGTP